MHVISIHFTYCMLYMTAVLCNKYVLSSLGFQYPTIFQGWQTPVAFTLINIFSGEFFKSALLLCSEFPWHHSHGCQKDFFQGEPKVVKYDFSHSRLRKQLFFAENFEIQGGLAPPPSDTHDHSWICAEVASVMANVLTEQFLQSLPKHLQDQLLVNSYF